MVASAFSPSPETAITVPKPNVSCDTRSPTESCRVELCFPVALGGGGDVNLFRVIGGVVKPLSDLFQSMRFSGISSRNLDGGL